MRGIKIAVFGVLLWLIGVGGGFFAGRGWELLHPTVPREITVTVERAAPAAPGKCADSPCNSLCLLDGRLVFQVCPDAGEEVAPSPEAQPSPAGNDGDARDL